MSNIHKMHQRIRTLRKEAKLTQAQMAQLLACSVQTYSVYELGDQIVPLHLLIHLADLHEVSVDYLLGRTNNRKLK